MGCAETPVSFSKHLPKLSQLTSQPHPVQTGSWTVSNTARTLRRAHMAAEGPAPHSLPPKAKWFIQTKRQSTGNIGLARSLVGGLRPRSATAIPGGVQEDAALPKTSEDGALPCQQQRKGHKGRRLRKAGVMNRSGGSSPTEPQRESRDAGRGALAQKCS